MRCKTTSKANGIKQKMGPNFDERFAPGNGTILEFTETRFVRYTQNQQIQAGTYMLTADTTSFNTHSTRITFLTNGTAFDQFLITSDTAIVIWQYGTNAESSLYKRWK